MQPFLSTCRELGCLHVSLFGSATRKPLAEVADIDLHVVLPRIDPFTFDSLLTAAEATARDVSARAGRPWRIESRHGPFKPLPGVERELQLHLLLDDEISLAQLPCALIAQRAATGVLLEGDLLFGIRVDCDWLREARVAIERWRGALVKREIPYRSWVFDPQPCLAEGSVAARTAWELRCLLWGAATATDLHFRAALSMSCQELETDDLTHPLLSQLGEVPPWQFLGEHWDRLSDRAAKILERRLDHIA